MAESLVVFAAGLALSALSSGTGPDLDMIKRLQDIGVTRVFMSSSASDRDGITRSLEKIGNEIIARL